MLETRRALSCTARCSDEARSREQTQSRHNERRRPEGCWQNKVKCKARTVVALLPGRGSEVQS